MSNSKGKLSIIVPVYNVESWLNKCIDSLLDETYEDIEILLIDDGSTDKSGEICDKYALKNKKIKVFHNKNQGLSYSRNFGIKNATGKYVMFVDSDDYISDKKIVDKFINILNDEKSDFIYTSYCRFNDGKDDEITEILPIDIGKNEIKNKSGIDILALLIKKNNYHHAAYLKICNRKFLIDNNLFFKEGIYHEDAEWSPKLFYYSRKISIYSEPYYMRRMRENSIITTTNEKSKVKKINDRLTVAYDLIKFFNALPEGNTKKFIINDLVRMYWGDLMLITNLKNKENINNCCNVVKDTRKILKTGEERKYKLGNTLMNIVGIKSFIKISKILLG